MTSTTATFGESTYGDRLDYGQPKWRDPFFAVLYYVHVAIIIIVAAYMWANTASDIDTSGSDTSSDFDSGGIFLGVIVCAVIGILFGLFWLQIMKKFAETIIKFMLFFNIAVWVLVAILGFILGSTYLIIIGILFAVIYTLYTWCVWRRIPFASVLLSISASITSTFSGVIWLSLSVILFNIIWIIIWISCVFAYIGYTTETSSFIIFLLLVSLYWGCQVNKNVSHTTTCGVAATWYFTKEVRKPTGPAFKRTMTTSFGSICLGSLIVAILQAIRAMLRNSSKNGGIATLIALCLLNCIEQLVRWFNKYAYAQCAIYGTSFIQSAKATFDLFKKQGIMALINDDLTSLAIVCGSIIGGVVSGGLGALVTWFYYQNDADYTWIPIVIGIYGFFIGYVLCYCVLSVLASSVICLFVCYAEDPAALAENRPGEYNRIVMVKPEFGSINPNYQQQQQHAQPAAVVMHAPVQQQQVVYQQPPVQQQQQVVYQQPQQQVVYVDQNGNPIQPQQQVVYQQPQQVVYQQPQQVVYQQPPAYAPAEGNGVR